MKCPAGTELLVYDIEMKFLGTGILIHDYDSYDPHTPMPEIKLSDGSFILGCECWWIPVVGWENHEKEN